MTESSVDSPRDTFDRVELDQGAFDKFKVRIGIGRNKHYFAHKDIDLQNFADGVVKLINTVVENKTDTIFFLDRSARPCAYLFLSTWAQLYPGKDHPSIKFINIGTESKMESISDDVINEVRERYKKSVGENVVVVDEYSETGDTMLKAERAMKVFFPESRIKVIVMFRDIPFWQGKSDTIGVSDYWKDNNAPHLVVRPFFGYQGEKDKAVIKISRKFRSDLVRLGTDSATFMKKVPLERK